MKKDAAKIIIISLTFLLIFGLNFNLNSNNQDFWLHLAFGKYFLEEKNFPEEDVFNFTTEGKQEAMHEWLLQSIMYFFYIQFGITSLIILKALIVTLTFFIFYKLINKNFYLSILLTILAAFSVNYFSFIRPHIFAWLFILLTFYLLKKEKYAFLPGLILLWTNMHASVVVGLFIIGVSLLEKAISKKDYKYILWIIICTITSLINPNTYEVLLYPFQVTGFGQYVKEWMPFPLTSYPIYLYSGFILLSIFLFIKHKKIRPSEIIFFLAFAYLGFRARRDVATAVLVITPLISGRLYLSTRRSLDRNTFKDMLLIISLIILTGISITSLNAFNPSIDYSAYPYDAVEFIKKKNIQGNIFNEDDFGGFLDFQFGPTNRVFWDGRLPIHGEEMIYYYHVIKKQLDGWDILVDRYNISIFLIKHDRDLEGKLLLDEDWKLVYVDGLSSVYVRDNEENKDLPSYQLVKK